MAKPRKPNTEKITQFNTWYSQDIEAYKKFCDNREKAHKYNQKFVTDLTEQCLKFLKNRADRKLPFTITGLYMNLDLQKKDYYRMKRGEFDWRLFEFMDHNNISEEDIQTYYDEYLGYLDYWISPDGEFFIMNTYSEVIEKALNFFEDQLEAKLYTGSKPTGPIFLLKSKFGWTDNMTEPVVNNSIHVADKKEAMEILNSLTLEEIEERRLLDKQ